MTHKRLNESKQSTFDSRQSAVNKVKTGKADIRGGSGRRGEVHEARNQRGLVHETIDVEAIQRPERTLWIKMTW